jgi:hypothetical protein
LGLGIYIVVFDVIIKNNMLLERLKTTPTQVSQLSV